MLQNTNKFTATAKVCAEFLPVLDRLEALKEVYGEDEFGQQYNAMSGAMRAALQALGVKEYGVSPGEAVDLGRVQVIESEFSEEFGKDTIIQPLSNGLELEGNTVRMATCVASLGSESVVEEEAAAEEAPEASAAPPSEGGEAAP